MDLVVRQALEPNYPTIITAINDVKERPGMSTRKYEDQGDRTVAHPPWKPPWALHLHLMLLSHMITKLILAGKPFFSLPITVIDRTIELGRRMTAFRMTSQVARASERLSIVTAWVMAYQSMGIILGGGSRADINRRIDDD